MLSEIKFSYPTWFLLLCVLLGAAYAVALYYRDNRFAESPKWSSLAMALLRMVAVTSIAALLLGPMVKTISEEVKQPIVVVAQDVSQSIVSSLDEDEVSSQSKFVSDFVASLATTYEVRQLSIGDQVVEGAVDSFTARITNLSNALEYIDDNYADQNLGAVILSTDGIYNEGKNPIYTNTNITAPLYIIAQGDTSIRRDVAIKNIFANKIAYLGDKFSIQIDVSSVNASGMSSNLSVTNVTEGQSSKIHSENITIKNDNFFTTKEIVISADQVGVNKYRVALTPVSGEVSKVNNYKDIYVEVLDARQKILLIANAPHPDLAALKQIITKNKNYEAEVVFAQDNGLQVKDYDMAILHNLPSEQHDLVAVMSELDKRRTPRLYIVGAQTNLQRFNAQQGLINIGGNGTNIENVQAQILPNFSSFTISENLSRTIKNFPPLIAPFGNYTDPLGGNVLMNQVVQDIETTYPMLSFSDKQGFKTGVLVGEGIWKWRLYNYVQSENYDLVEELINKTIQFVSTKEDKRKFRASTSKNLYKENKDIIFDGQLYNDNYEMINSPDVFVSVRNANKEYKFTMSRSNNYYTLNANLLPPGKYAYEATTNFDGQALSQKGYFSVEDIQLELYDLTARHGLLRSLSNKYGGKVVLPSEASSLIASLTGENKLKPTVYPSTRTKSVINFKWLFWIFLCLLSGEWFLRRYMGSY